MPDLVKRAESALVVVVPPCPYCPEGLGDVVADHYNFAPWYCLMCGAEIGDSSE